MNLDKNKVIAGLLLGRSGSVGFPGKNTYPIMGRPLMVYPMLAGLNSKYIDKMFFSTDSDEYKHIGRDHGLEIIDRPAELATKQALGEDAFVHGYKMIKEYYVQQGKELEILVLFFCNSATILSETIDEGIEVLLQHPDYDSAVTVSAYNMWSPLRARRETAEGLLQPFVPFETFGDPRTLNCDRDSQGDVLFADMGISIVRPRCLDNLQNGLLPQKWMGQRIYPIKQWGGCDIDFEWQVPGVIHWLQKHGFSETTTPYDFQDLVLPIREHLNSIERTKNTTHSRLGYLRLDKNENLISVPDAFLSKLRQLITSDFISAYPEVDQLYAKLAKFLEVSPDNLFLTSGSDAAIKAAFEVFVAKNDGVLILDPTYAMFYVYAKIFQAKIIAVGYEGDLSLSADKVIQQIYLQKPKLICIANPNSPTGTIFSPSDIERIIRICAELGSVVLLDEAYYPFYPQSGIDLIKIYPNLLVTRTFSKAEGLASVRLGYSIGHKKMIDCLHKVRPMYEINAFAARFAELILDNYLIVKENLAEIQKGREYLEAELIKMKLPFFKTYANFININVGSREMSIDIAKFMHDHKILIKGGFDGVLKNCVRVNFGSIDQMRKFLDCLKMSMPLRSKTQILTNYNSDELFNYYTNHRTSWDELYPTEKQSFERLRLLSNGRLEKILDVGCACGGLAKALAEKFQIDEYVGIDISSSMIAGASQLCSCLPFAHHFIVGDVIENNDLKNERFDLVTSLSCADWNANTEQIITRCWNYVKSGGYFLISLRLTTEKGCHDIKNSYQYVWFDHNKPIPDDTPVTSYVVFNVEEALGNIKNIFPRVSHVISYGAWHEPSFSARTPFTKLFFSVFLVRKGESNSGNVNFELNWPEEILSKINYKNTNI